jgi:hypothetical protein
MPGSIPQLVQSIGGVGPAKPLGFFIMLAVVFSAAFIRLFFLSRRLRDYFGIERSL